MLINEQMKKKWEGVINHADLPQIKDSYRKAVTTRLLENQEEAMIEARGGMLTEAGVPTNVSGGLGAGTNIDSFDPVLISLVRRSMPNLIAY